MRTWFRSGRLARLSIKARIFAGFGVILATTVIFAAAFVVCNLIAELIYGVVDPRVRIGSAR